MRARRMIVRRNDYFRQFIEQRELSGREVQRLRAGELAAERGNRRNFDHFAAIHQTFPFFSSSAKWSQERHASAMIVQVGFWQDALTWLDPSTTSRFFTSCDCWN